MNPKQNGVMDLVRWAYPPLKGVQIEEKTLPSFWKYKFSIKKGLNWVGMDPFGLRMGRIDVESSQESF